MLQAKNVSKFNYPNGYHLIAGVDEVGRGTLIGNVVAAAVILDPNKPITGLTDSKKLTAKKRSQLALEIKDKALSWAIASATAAEIDKINILQASLLAMSRAINSLSVTPDLALIDGNQLPKLITNGTNYTPKIALQSVVGGDLLVSEISAASILAKVARDHEMVMLDKVYPQLGLAKHKGYATKEHIQALALHGITEQHRKSFKPVKKYLEN